MKSVLSVATKEFIQLFRDRATLLVIFVVPVLQMFILAYAVTMEVERVPLGVWDRDKSRPSRELVREFGETKYFDIAGSIRSRKEAVEAIEENRAMAIIQIPKGFERDLSLKKRADVSLLLDGVDANSATVALGYSLAILEEFSYGKESRTGEQYLLGISRRIRYNPDLKSTTFMVPGILAVLLLIITMFLSSMSIVRERELGTFEQLIVLPISSLSLIIGKILPFAILAFLELGIALTVATLWFHIHIAGGVMLLYVFSLIFLMTTLGIGILVSTVTTTQQQAMFISWFLMVFTIITSGLFIPIENMPNLVQYLTYLNPLRYFIVILRGIILKGSGLGDLWQQGATLFAFGFAIIFVSTLRFRKSF